MVSSHSALAHSSGCHAFAESACSAKLAYSRATLALSSRCRSRAARAVRPAPLAASARHSVCHQSLVKVGALCSQAWACQPCKTASFGHAGLAFPASVSEHFMRLPVSQRLQPQCIVMQTHSNAKLSASTARASESKAKRCIALQTPNPSFKRTCLRHAA